MRTHCRQAIGAVFVVLVLFAHSAPGQPEPTYEVLHAFPFSNRHPTSMLETSDGSVYGTTREGGGSNLARGTIFRLTDSGFETLHCFHEVDGAHPWMNMIESSDGSLYGTTERGGNGAGTVFRLMPSGDLITLHYFVGADGRLPHGALLEASDGNLYGTTRDGGADDKGTVFKLERPSDLTTLHSFDDGSEPSTLIETSDGNFYGTTTRGGPSGVGTIFRLTLAGEFETLHVFDEANGAYPVTLIKSRDGNVCGTTTRGGSSDWGTVFRLTPSGDFETLHSFSTEDEAIKDGVIPIGLVESTDGSFYGTATFGGESGWGTVFRMSSSGELETIHSFSGVDGGRPEVLIQSSDGGFYGATREGGPGGGGRTEGGVLFRLGPLTPPVFRRGDCNDDGMVDISDAVFSLHSLFLGDGDPGCDDACDSNDDGEVDSSDAIATLGVLFLGNGVIPLPGMTECGVDPTDDDVSCDTFNRCP